MFLPNSIICTNSVELSTAGFRRSEVQWGFRFSCCFGCFVVGVENRNAQRKCDTCGVDEKPPECGLVVTCCLGKARLVCHAGCHGLVRHEGRELCGWHRFGIFRNGMPGGPLILNSAVEMELRRNKEAKLKPLGVGTVLEILHLAGETIEIHNFACILGFFDSS